MRYTALLLLLVGCIGEREGTEPRPEPYVAFASLTCSVVGAQVVIEGTWNVQMSPGETFRVDHVTTLGAAKANVYSFYGCNGWNKTADGCTRLEGQRGTNPVSLRVTDNITSGTLPKQVRVEVIGVAENDDIAIEASRTIDCVY
jgi:hypothetical protein